MPIPPGDPWLASPMGGGRNQTARIHRIENDVGADGRVGGGLELRLVIEPVQIQAAGEINQHLLLIEGAQHLHRCLQRG